MSRLWAAVAGGVLAGAAGLYYVLSRRRESEGLTEPPLVESDVDLPDFPALEVQPGRYLAAEAAQAFLRMQAAAALKGVSLPLTTAYRSQAYQQRLYDAWMKYKLGLGPKAPQAAKPGNSYHQKGIAIDITGIDPSNPNFNAARRSWLLLNAPGYDWHNTGANFNEPWHWVYGTNREGSGPPVA